MKTTQLKAVAVAFTALLAWNLFGSHQSTADAGDRVRFGISVGGGGSGLYVGSGYGAWGAPGYYGGPVYRSRVYPVYPATPHCGPPVVGHHYGGSLYGGYGYPQRGYSRGYGYGYHGRHHHHHGRY